MRRGKPVLIEWTEEHKPLIKKHILEPGSLIAIPTETVYGLAANAFCETSVRRIYEVKRRPLSDPVIIHVTSFNFALEKIFNVDLYQTFVIQLLARKFSPGPLTVVAKGHSYIPYMLSANTGFPAVRCPNHPLTLSLLEYIGVPLAAPSANKFGHISPTTVEHVLSEFPNDPIYVIDGGACAVGIESTVVKITSDDAEFDDGHFNCLVLEGLMKKMDILDYLKTGELPVEVEKDEEDLLMHLYKSRTNRVKLTVLRKGGISSSQIEELFDKEIFSNISVVVADKFIENDVTCPAPGMLLSHYAPNVDTYILSIEGCANTISGGTRCLEHNFYFADASGDHIGEEGGPLSSVVMVDMTGKLEEFREYFGEYTGLPTDSHVIAHELYNVLRTAESLALSIDGPGVIAICFESRSEGLDDAIYDRIYRASSGKFITIKYKNTKD